MGRVRGFLKRKRMYLLMELAVLFLVFVQYIVGLTVEEKEDGQAVFQTIEENRDLAVPDTDTNTNSETAENSDMENSNIENSDTENNNTEHSEAETKEEESGEAEDSEAKDSEAEDSKGKDSEVKDSEVEDSKGKDSEKEDSEIEKNKIEQNKTELSTEKQKIRVLLKTTEGKENYHNSVKIIPSEDCILSVLGSSAKTKTLKAGKAVTFRKSSSWLKKGTVLLSPKNQGKIKICSIQRSYGNPSYRGTLELTKTKQGIFIVNELLLEEYLYAVVPSEMPVSYGIEALKVQAVCARCYAYSQLGSSAMKEFHADVDDSTSYQVYNNVAETQDSKKAVDATAGLVPVSADNTMITAYYYSTSCGYTANISDAWERKETKEEGVQENIEGSTGESVEGNIEKSIEERKGQEEDGNQYLVGKPQFIKQKEAEKILDLSKEKNFLDFLEKETRQTFDSAFPWYRWTVSISKKELQKSIEENLEERRYANPSMIETAEEKTEGEEETKPLNSRNFGKWKALELVNRSETGMVTCIKIIYEKEEIFVYGEYNIRCLLSPGNAKIKRQDGSVVSGLSLLPSSFFSVKRKGQNYIFTGGGYGHGVGMSQNGVKTMVEKGYSWEEVLQHYYQGVKIENIENIL